MPAIKTAPSQVQTTKQGAESIFVGPAFVSFLGGAVIVTGMAFDRWYMTSRINDITRYGLFQSCVYDNCISNEFGSFVSTASCSGSGESWEPRSIASAALIAFGLFILLISFLTNAAAAFTRNMIYFFWTTILLWLAVATIAAGGAVQYHLFGYHLFCGITYCSYSQERYGDSRFCSEAYGMSTYLWFVGLCMLGANALGCLMLNIGWRKRLSATWALRGVQSKALYIPGSGEGDEEMNNNNNNNNRSASAAGGGGSSPRRINNNNSSNWVPEGYYWDEQAGYYYSEDQGWYYDAVSQQYYDPQSELWYDPINQSWG